MKADLKSLTDSGKLKYNLSETPVMSFEAYCSITTLAVKYSVIRVNAQERVWDTQRRKLIRKRK